ncbi:MAG: LytTR family DNA-binding domain-containing protein [Sporolactobacillus sp.]|uniref:LytR/AlgR family response regulator transcription factor n=1 Tax=Sporolactobacillus sp. STSJ-5 TaxID=2965076 RepID=UPI0021059B41|nr:LytTR family DNA-binding domain-containing protein [Sporolactobacillus sp. STSJ-5]MCQ2008633.1 LytTR family DNA-binding domain-containing protein [Sporolactobacillus sp. STSJ-5]
MKIAICDDDKTQREYLATLVKEWARKNNKILMLELFENAQGFLFSWSTDQSYDALLLDIQMPVLNGMELARKIRERDELLAIIFITGFSDYMDEGYEVSALHYLIKPVKEERLFTVLDRASKKVTKQKKTLLIEQNGEMIRVNQEDILCLEAFAHTIDVTTAEQHYQVKVSIDQFERQLDPHLFVRPHRSYLVGLKYISQLRKTGLTLDTGKKIPVSRRRYQAVNQAFIRFFRGGTEQ